MRIFIQPMTVNSPAFRKALPAKRVLSVQQQQQTAKNSLFTNRVHTSTGAWQAFNFVRALKFYIFGFVLLGNLEVASANQMVALHYIKYLVRSKSDKLCNCFCRVWNYSCSRRPTYVRNLQSKCPMPV